MSLDFAANPLWVNPAIFALAGVLVWWAGSGLVDHAERIARLTGLTSGLVGLLLLATATSLPELATTISATATGAARMGGRGWWLGSAAKTCTLNADHAFTSPTV